MKHGLASSQNQPNFVQLSHLAEYVGAGSGSGLADLSLAGGSSLLDGLADIPPSCLAGIAGRPPSDLVGLALMLGSEASTPPSEMKDSLALSLVEP